MRRRVAVRDDVEPVAIASVFRDSTLIGSKQDGTRGRAQALDQPQYAGREIQARDVISEILLGHVIHLTAKAALLFHHELHGFRLRLEVRL